MGPGQEAERARTLQMFGKMITEMKKLPLSEQLKEYVNSIYVTSDQGSAEGGFSALTIKSSKGSGTTPPTHSGEPVDIRAFAGLSAQIEANIDNMEREKGKSARSDAARAFLERVKAVENKFKDEGVVRNVENSVASGGNKYQVGGISGVFRSVIMIPELLTNIFKSAKAKIDAKKKFKEFITSLKGR